MENCLAPFFQSFSPLTLILLHCDSFLAFFFSPPGSIALHSLELSLSSPHFNGSARLYALDWDVLEHIAVLSVSDSSSWFTVLWDLLSTLWCPLRVALVSGRRWVCVLCLVYWAPGRLGRARHRTRAPFSHTQTGPLILLSALSLFITQIAQKPDDLLLLSSWTPFSLVLSLSLCHRLPSTWAPFVFAFSSPPILFHLSLSILCLVLFQCPTNTCQFQPAVSVSLSFYLPLSIVIYHSRFSIPVLCLPESHSEISKREFWSAHSTALFFWTVCYFCIIYILL